MKRVLRLPLVKSFVMLATGFLIAFALVGAGSLPASAGAQDWAVGDIQLSAGPVVGPELTCASLPAPSFGPTVPTSPWSVDVTASVPPLQSQTQYVLSYRFMQGAAPASGWTSDASPSSQAYGWLSANSSRQTVTIRTPVMAGATYEMRLQLNVAPEPILSPTIRVAGPPGITCTSPPPNESPGSTAPSGGSGSPPGSSGRPVSARQARDTVIREIKRSPARLKGVKVACSASAQGSQICVVSGRLGSKRVKRYFTVTEGADGQLRVKRGRR